MICDMIDDKNKGGDTSSNRNAAPSTPANGKAASSDQSNQSTSSEPWVPVEEDASIEFVTSTAAYSTVSPVYAGVSVAQNMDSYEYLREDGRYLHIGPEDLAMALAADTLTVTCEEDVYELLLDWVYYDFEHRKQYFGLLFEKLRLFYIPATYLQKIIKCEELVVNNPTSYNAVMHHERRTSKLGSGNLSKFSSSAGPRSCYRDLSILVCGGKGTETLCELYNPATNSWKSVREMPAAGRSNATVLSLGEDKVCFVGGEDKLKCIVNAPVSYQVGFGWTEGIAVPGQNRSGARTATLEGKTYLIGGISADEGYTHSVERFNADCNRWVPVKSMDFPRFSFGCAELGGFIYSCGGFDGEKDVKSCEFFMPDANEWTAIAPMNVARSGCKTVAAEGKLYTLGGWNGTEILSSCEVYDPRSNRWSRIQSMNRPRHGLDVVAIGNVIYAIGGWNGQKKLSSVERYHTRSDCWELVKPMSVGRWLTTATTLPMH